MTNRAGSEPSTIESDQDRERYSGGYGPRVIRGLSRRSVTTEGAFFLPYLRPGMRVLDCGCGPGTMTVSLAEVVAPGETIGLDPAPEQFAIGRELAQQRGVRHVRFEQGTIYQLPFAEASFDAVFAHAVLYHLREPRTAFKEMHRVLRPGGVVGVRDSDFSGDLYAPVDPLLDHAWELLAMLVRHNGGNPRFGPTQRAALRQAGFVDIVASASYDTYGTPELTGAYAAFWADFLGHQHADLIIAEGWATRADLVMMESALQAWGKHPDAFAARARCEAVGWKAKSSGTVSAKADERKQSNDRSMSPSQPHRN